MPVQRCREKGKPGFRWGESGKCYTYSPKDKDSIKKATEKAIQQGQAIKANKE